MLYICSSKNLSFYNNAFIDFRYENGILKCYLTLTPFLLFDLFLIISSSLASQSKHFILCICNQ